MTSNLKALTAAVLAATALYASPAFAVSASVKFACAGDYFAYCSQHSPNSPQVRGCMRAVGAKLSLRCVKALVAAGEVSKSEVQQKAAAAGKPF